jgi:hypothetical protein
VFNVVDKDRIEVARNVERLGHGDLILECLFKVNECCSGLQTRHFRYLDDHVSVDEPYRIS